MEKVERYKFDKAEIYKIFGDILGKRVSRIRTSTKKQIIVCEVYADGHDLDDNPDQDQAEIDRTEESETENGE